MRRRAVSAVLAVALVAAALSLAGCAGRRARRQDAPKAELAAAQKLADDHRYDAALRLYMRLAERTQVGGKTFDLAMAGAASSFTAKIATMTVTGRIDAVSAFYEEYAARLHPPALVTYTSAVLDEAAREQVVWAEAFERDRTRWLKEIGARGTSREAAVHVGRVGGFDVQLMTPEQARRIATAVPRLDQPGRTAELYTRIASLAEANRIYVSLEQSLANGATITQAQVDDAIRANGIVARNLPRAKAILAQGR